MSLCFRRQCDEAEHLREDHMEILTNTASPHRGIVRVLLLGVLMLAPVRVFAQELDEYAVKAAFIFNFTKFIEWPAQTLNSSPVFVIGILGDDPFGSLIDEVTKGKKVKGREIQIRRLKDPAEAKDCRIV